MPITQYTGSVPNANNPATFAANASALLAWLVGLPGEINSLLANGVFVAQNNVITDLTAALEPGLYSFAEQTATGSPGTGSFWVTLEVRQIRQSGTVHGQTFIATRMTATTTSRRKWSGSRNGNSGAITWVEEIIVVETGSSGAGRYTKYSDGTLVCEIQNFVTVSGGPATWTFPAAFINNEIAIVFGSRSTAPRSFAYQLPSVSAAEIQSWDSTTGSDAVAPTVALIARGKWR